MNTVPAALADDAPHLLLVDDDRRIRDLLSRFLLAEGYRVTTAGTAADARAKLEGLRFGLVILDVLVAGGADAYRAKPFERRELPLRIAGILRRSRPAVPPSVETVRFGDFNFHM